MDKWADACRAQTNLSNTYQVGETRYFWESSNHEHDDGAITGTIWRMLGMDPNKGQCIKAGPFRIEPDGRVSKAPPWLKDIQV